MPIVKGESLIQQIRDHNPQWFTPENKRFFNDIAYYGLWGINSGKPYLVQYTNAWTDMFGQKPRSHYRVHTIDSDGKIESALDDEFRTIEDVKDWLKEN
jgi:hypothetical protein